MFAITIEVRVATDVFHLPILVCFFVIPIASIGVFSGYEIGAYTNIESSCEAHHLFVKMPLTC
jgi:hypothetical protein